MNIVQRTSLIILFTLCSVFLVPRAAFAYTLSAVNVNGENDFVLEPGKAEFLVDPGQSIQKDIFITNRTNRTVKFKIEIEDFIGSSDPLNPVVLLDGDKSPYSFK